MADMEPVNIATPNWACPICGTEHFSNLAAAKACVALGQPDGYGAAPRIVVWDHSPRVDANLAVVDLGKITRDRVDGEYVHALRYSNGAPASLGVGYTPGTVVEVGGYPRSHVHRQYRSVVADRIARDRGRGRISTVNEPCGWTGRLTPAAIEALDMLFGPQWALLRNSADAPSAHRWGYWNERSRDGIVRPGAHQIAAAAVSHGFAPWDIEGMTRWGFAHAETIDAALAERYQRWIDGDDVAVPRLSMTPVVKSQYGGHLPRKPGKAREALAAGWGHEFVPGDDAHSWYRVLAEIVLDSLATPTPPAPIIPGAPCATEFYSATRKATS